MATALPEKIPEEQPGVGEAVRILVAADPDLARELSTALQKLCINEGRGWSRRLHLVHSGHRWPKGTGPLRSEIEAIEMAADRGEMCLSAGEDADRPLTSFRFFQMADVRGARVLRELRAALDDRRKKEPDSPQADLGPLTDDAQRVARLLIELPPAKGLTGKELSNRLSIPEDRIRSGIRDELIPYGIQNQRGARGYFFDAAAQRALRAALGDD